MSFSLHVKKKPLNLKLRKFNKENELLGMEEAEKEKKNAEGGAFSSLKPSEQRLDNFFSALNGNVN